MRQGKVAIIIANYNGKYTLERCIQSILKSTYDNYEIIVADDRSTDGYEQIIKKKYPMVTLLINKNNGGFANVNNMGIRYALQKDFSYICLLNNDTEVDKNVLSELIENSQDNLVTVPKMYNMFNRRFIWYGGGTLNYESGEVKHEGGMDAGQCDEKKEVSFATFCCILFPVDVIRKVGFLDEQYYMYYEDVDYCRRLKENGIPIIYVPSAIIYHEESSSMGGEASPLKHYYAYRNQLIYLQKSSKKRFSDMIIRCIKALKKKEEQKEKIYKKALNHAIFDYVAGRNGKNVRQYKGIEDKKTMEGIAIKNRQLFNGAVAWLMLYQEGKSLEKYFQTKEYKRIGIYGYSALGQCLVRELHETEVVYVIDKRADQLVSDVKMYASVPEDGEEIDALIVTAISDFRAIRKTIGSYVNCPIISLEEVISFELTS